jgi:Flp pilus assembly protein TadB
MQWIQIVIFLLIVSGLFSLFSVRFNDFLHVLAPAQKNTLQDNVDVLLGKPAKGFFNRETLEIEQLLKATGREGRFNLIKRASIILFALGAVLALLLNNPFMIPILGAGFAFAPVWYLRSTAAAYKKNLNEELETAISVITTSYLRSGDLLKAVRENIPYLNPPVKTHFEAFITESEMLNANMISTINTLKMKIPNQIFHEWCNTLIQCQSDRSMKNTLTFTVQKFSDMRIIQSELEAIINEPKKEAITMMFLVMGNIPLLYVLNHAWFETLLFSTPGKITLAICSGIVLFSFTRIMQLSKPVEYKA